MMLERAGFEIIDLGVDVAPEKFIESSASGGANIVACSAGYRLRVYETIQRV